MYRVYKNNNRNQFVETTSFKFAKSLAKEETRKGNKIEIKENRNGRWFTVKEDK